MDNSTLIDYLYGEMNTNEKAEFEARMQEDPELKLRLAGLSSVRHTLQEDEDIEPSGSVQLFQPTKRSFPIRRWLAIAASVLVLLLAGKMLDLRIQLDEGALSFQYGEIESNESLDRQEILHLIAKEFDAQQSYVTLRLDEMDRKILPQDKINPIPAAIETQFASYEQQLSSMQEDIRQDQLSRYNQFLDRMDRDQRNYSRELMQDIFEYVEAQRQQDLQAINEGFKTITRVLQTGDETTQFINPTTQKY